MLFPELKFAEVKRSKFKQVQTTHGQLKLFYSGGYARYTMRKMRQTPAWADKKKIAAIYAEARKLTIELNWLHVVDHIVPLNGITVNGLHTEQNLHVVRWELNASKCNHYWPDMWTDQLELI